MPRTLPLHALILVTSYLASVQTPLHYTRTFVRDTGLGLHRHEAVTAGDRVSVAKDIVTFLQIHLTFGNEFGCSDPWCLSALVDRMTESSMLGIDSSWQLDVFNDLVEVGLANIDDFDPMESLATIYLLRAAEVLTRPFSPAPRSIRGDGIRIADLEGGDHCLMNFRFHSKEELFYLFQELALPVIMQIPSDCSGRGDGYCYNVNGETCFLVFLARMATGDSFYDLAKTYDIADAGLACRIFHHMLIYFDDNYGWLVDGSAPRGDLNRWASQLESWYQCVYAQLFRTGVPDAYFKAVCLFIDGTFRPMNRPGETSIFADLQRLFYTTYKKTHGLNFQAVTSPNGLVIDLFGPSPGSHNDLNLVSDSSIVARLSALFALRPFREYRCYGDAIYTLSTAIIRCYRSLILTPHEKRQNRMHNRERTTVEQVFGKVVQLWKYVDFARNFRFLGSPSGVGRAYRVACLFTNFHTCMHGSQVTSHFGIRPPEVSDYINGGVEPNDY